MITATGYTWEQEKNNYQTYRIVDSDVIAIIWTGDNALQVRDFLASRYPKGHMFSDPIDKSLTIQIENRSVVVQLNDAVVIHLENNSIYAYTKEFFHNNYQPVNP